MTQHLTVGTAGHIDHGKTALVRALTGRDTDRLAEEKRRGISIELGFAELDLGARKLSLIDVPGHERFVRTMVAGASGIDLFLMVIAADEGVMPQTDEHAAVLAALGVKQGVVALTKCDLADDRARAEAAQEVRGLFPDAPLVEVSSRTRQGLAELRGALAAVAQRVGDGANLCGENEATVLHVDRVFTISGRGTVVTGTLWSGTVRRGERLAVLPGDLPARVREIQVHDRPQDAAGPRQRVALNLAGLKSDAVRRGDVVTSAESGVRPTYRIDVELELLGQRLAERERVQVHHGTREAPARIVPLEEGLAQLRLEAPLLVRAGDRVVVRRIAPPDTLGGGRVLDAEPRRHGSGAAVDRLRRVRGGGPWQDGGATGPGGVGGAAAQSREPEAESPDPAIAPLSGLAQRALETLRLDGAMPRGPRALAETLEVSQAEVTAALDTLAAAGHLVRISSGVCYPTAELEALKEQAIAIARPRGSVTIAELRDGLGISRKYSQALLGHLDSSRVTLRRDDRHVLRRSHAFDRR